jgi:hypothetical protein
MSRSNAPVHLRPASLPMRLVHNWHGMGKRPGEIPSREQIELSFRHAYLSRSLYEGYAMFAFDILSLEMEIPMETG